MRRIVLGAEDGGIRDGRGAGVAGAAAGGVTLSGRGACATQSQGPPTPEVPCDRLMPPARRSGSFPGGGSRDESGGGIRFTHDCRAQLGPGAEGLPPRGLDTPAPGCDPGVAEKTLTTTRGRFGRPLAPPPFRGDAARGSHLASRAERRLDRRRMDSLLRPIRWPSQLRRPVFTRVRTENRLDGHSACLSLLQTRVENVAHAGEAKLAAAPGRVRRDSDGSPVLCYAVVPVDLSEVLSRAQARAAAADRGRGLCGGHLWTGRLRGGAIQGAMPQAGGPALDRDQVRLGDGDSLGLGIAGQVDNVERPRSAGVGLGPSAGPLSSKS